MKTKSTRYSQQLIQEDQVIPTGTIPTEIILSKIVPEEIIPEEIIPETELTYYIMCTQSGGTCKQFESIFKTFYSNVPIYIIRDPSKIMEYVQ